MITTTPTANKENSQSKTTSNSKPTPGKFNDLVQEQKKVIQKQEKAQQVEDQEKLTGQSSESFHNTNFLFQSKTAEVSFDDIRIADWFSKRYISKAEVNRSLEAIKQGGLGVSDILLRYVKNDKGEKYYELVDGIVTLRAYQELGLSSYRCRVIDDPKFKSTDAMLVNLSLNTRNALTPWESTVLALTYLVKTFNLTTSQKYIKDPVTKIRTIHSTSARTKAVALCKRTLKFREARGKLSNEQKLTNDEYKELEEDITPQVEATINAMLSSIGVDLVTFVQKRVKLIDLPNEIKQALEKGEIFYSKAISISRIGKTPELKSLVDQLGDDQVVKDIEEEMKSLLKETIEKNLSSEEVVQKANEANMRILARATDMDNYALSDQEIDNRKEFREDLELQAKLRNDLVTAARTVKKQDFMQKLTEREKSNIQKQLTSLVTTINSLNVKYYNRSLKLTLARK